MSSLVLPPGLDVDVLASQGRVALGVRPGDGEDYIRITMWQLIMMPNANQDRVIMLIKILKNLKCESPIGEKMTNWCF